jgi:hypothetical protein
MAECTTKSCPWNAASWPMNARLKELNPYDAIVHEKPE